MAPIDPDATTPEVLVGRYLPDRLPQNTLAKRAPGYLLGVLGGSWLAGAILSATGLWDPSPFSWLILVAIVLVVTFVGVEVWVRHDYEQKMRRLRRDMASGALLGDIATRFRADIDRYRQRTLGQNSEWGRARHPLAAAKDEANRAVAYWTERAEAEGGSDLARDQLALARRLETKLGRAIRELDERAEALRAFLNRCEAKLATLEARSRDHEESARLLRLSHDADVQSAEAREALDRIGRDFMAEAVQVANALGGLQQLHLLDEAERLDVDQLETVAERIVEVSAADRRALGELERDLTGESDTFISAEPTEDPAEGDP